MKKIKKTGLITGLAVLLMAGQFMLHRTVSAAAGFTPSQIQNASVHFTDGSGAKLAVTIGGQDYEFDGNPPSPITLNSSITYNPKDSSLFCVPGLNSAGAKPIPQSSYLRVNISKLQPLTGSFSGNGQGDPAAVPDSNLYAGSTNQNCVRSLPNNKSVSLAAGAQTSAIFNDKSIKNIKGSDFTFNDGANITFVFGNSQINLYDQQPEDNTRNFGPKTSADASLFCGTISGLTFQNQDQEKDPLPVTFQVAYIDTTKGDQCSKKTLSLSVANPDKIATKVLQWNAESIQSITGGMTLIQQAGSKLVYLGNQNDSCGGGHVVILDAAGGDSGTLFQIAAGKADPSRVIGQAFPQCTVKAERSVLISGTPSSTGTAGAASTDSSACGANSHTSLEWLLCPLTTAISKFVDETIKVIEEQLDFDVKGYLVNGGDVQKVWSLVKNLVSAVVVVVLLIMVISQAIGEGAFDAYTIKKLLPKLIIAVIAMQFSWEMAKYLITIADDLGHGLRQIMLAPFGSAGNMDLNSILNHLNPAWALGVNAVGFYGLILAVLAFSEFILPILLFVAFAVAMSVITAMATLVFRNVLIVLLVITFPVALLLWALPGQFFQRYWKMWNDNFTKLLMVFPIMIAIIYAGRIVAWIAGGLGKPGLLDFMVVVVAYFGPLFILPKAFKWGGSWLGSASNAINNSWPIKKGREVGFRELRGNIDRKSGERSNYNPFDDAFTGRGTFRLPRNRLVPKSLRGQQMAWLPTGGRGITRIKSGSIIPTARGRALTQKKHKDWKDEQKALRRSYVDRQYEEAEARGMAGRFWGWDPDYQNADGTTGNWVDNNDNIDRITGLSKKGVGAGKLAVMRAMLHGDERERKAAMEKFYDTSSAIEGQTSGINLNPDAWDDGTADSQEIREYITNELRPHIEREYGIGNLDVNAAGDPIMPMYMHPEFDAIQDNSPQYWGGLKRGDWLPPVIQTRYSDRLMDNYGITDPVRRNQLRGKRLMGREKAMYAMDGNYIEAKNIDAQPQGWYQEVKKLQDPAVSARFANILATIASGGAGSIQKLVDIAGSEGSSLKIDMNGALEPLGITIDDIITGAQGGEIPKFRIDVGHEGERITDENPAPSNPTDNPTDGGGHEGDDDDGINGQPTNNQPRNGGGGGNSGGAGGAGTTQGNVRYTSGQFGSSTPSATKLDDESIAKLGRKFAQSLDPTLKDLSNTIKIMHNNPPTPPTGPPPNPAAPSEEPPNPPEDRP